jgi:hypothetical protein
MVAVSLAGEFVADGGVFVFSSQLQAISDNELAGVSEEALDADERAVIAENKNSDLRLAAIQPRRASRDDENWLSMLLGADTETLKAEGHRRLDTARNLEKFGGIPVFIQSEQDSESSALAKSIGSTLLAAKWKVRLIGPMDTGIPNIEGVSVFTVGDPLENIGPGYRSRVSGAALVAYLDSRNVLMSVQRRASDIDVRQLRRLGFNLTEDAVIVFVGRRNIALEADEIGARRIRLEVLARRKPGRRNKQ